MSAYSALYSNIAQSFGESFDNKSSSANTSLVAVLVVVILVVVQLFVIQFLWNLVLVPLVTVVRPMKSLMYPLGLIVLLAMIMPGCYIALE